jgi:hypothetical protein
MMRLIIACLMLGAAAPGVPVAAMAQPAPAAARIDGNAAAAEIRRVLARNYVLPDVRSKLDAALAKGLAEGRYEVTDPATLAERINADLAAVTSDKHLGLQYDPTRAASLAAQPPGAGADDAPPSAEDIRVAQSRNHGIVEMRLLPGNVRYLKTNGFVWAGPKSAEAYDTAMRFLRDGNAAIIDLRHNGGGSPDAVQYMISHFIEANRPLVTFHMGAEGVNQLSSLPALPAGRMVGKPLYVLTSGMTASAAEEFAGHVAGFKLGELIGETTAGAGFRNEFFPIPGGFLLSVSVGRAVLASTGKDWEGVGIAPTTKAAIDKALEVAQVRALRRIAATAAPADKPEIEATATLLSAQVEPVTTALPLSAYTGTFGERVVTLEGGKLAYRRNGGPKVGIVPIGANRFAFENDAMTRLDYTVSGNTATGIELVRRDGSRVTASRTQ